MTELSDKVITLHPDRSKKGVNIDRQKYELMKTAIVEALQSNKPMTLKELEQAVTRQLKGSFDGSIMWYLMSVKLDLEARRMVQRVPFTQPARLRLTAKA
jgi:hypothetical protein